MDLRPMRSIIAAAIKLPGAAAIANTPSWISVFDKRLWCGAMDRRAASIDGKTRDSICLSQICI